MRVGVVMAYDFNLNYAKEQFEKGNKDVAYKYIKDNKVDVISDVEVVVHYVNYVMDKGYYEEGLTVIEDAMGKHPTDEVIIDLDKKHNDSKYKTKAEEYNSKSKWYDGADCCMCCDIDCCDICVDTGVGDSGCIDLDLCCFCDC